MVSANGLRSNVAIYIQPKPWHNGALYAIAAAALFGASTPAAKLLLGDASPLLIAGLLYLGSGLGLVLVRLGRRRTELLEAPLRGSDWLWLGGATLFGGILGPVLLMTGLAQSTAATASLLLNVEAVATALIAWLVFREHASGRTVVGMALVLLGAAMLTWTGKPTLSGLFGPLMIVAACLAWAIDNNLTRNISGSDAVQIASVKSLVAGLVNTGLAFLVMHAAIPDIKVLIGATLIGFLGYGVSLVCYIFALRNLGTARTAAYFSTAPFIGAAIAAAMGSAVLDARFFIASAFMLGGVWLHVSEEHGHEHVHEMIEHEHAHIHDEHHQHEHSPADPPGEPHSHRHKHDALVHAHVHFPDLHHRHTHEA